MRTAATPIRHTIRGVVQRRTGIMSEPAAHVALELLCDEKVLATTHSNFEGGFVFELILPGGTYQMRAAACPESPSVLRVGRGLRIEHNPMLPEGCR